MSPAIPSLVWAALLGFGVWRLETVLRNTLIPFLSPLAKRYVAVQERLAVVEEQKVRPKTPPRTPGTAMPQELMQLANKESSPWAREDTIKALTEAYEQAGDWEAVKRNALFGM